MRSARINKVWIGLARRGFNFFLMTWHSQTAESDPDNSGTQLFQQSGFLLLDVLSKLKTMKVENLDSLMAACMKS